MGIIRTKIVAILLGPSGVGIIGVFQSIIDLMRSGYGFGIDTAAVRDVAAANSTEDENKLTETVSLFQKLFFLSALAGLIGCVIFCYPISLWAFDDGAYSIHIALLSISIFFAILTTGQSSILQGMRKIKYMAQASIIGSIISLTITFPLYYFLGTKGITPYFILINIAAFASVNYFYKKLNIETTKISYHEAYTAGKETLKFGLYVVVAGLIGTFSMFLIRGIIIRNIDIDAAGLFQSAWTITTVYLALILRSMGTDFFPRLSSIIDNNKEANRLVNEQSYITLLIASPLIVGMIIFSGLAISILYSSDFSYADNVLRWQLAGTFLKVLSWPLAFIMLAKNKGRIFLITEIIFYAIYLLSCQLFIDRYRLDITGIGYLAAYIVYLPTVFIIGKRISGFGWNKEIWQMVIVNSIFITVAFCICMYCNQYEFLFGGVLLVLTLGYSFVKLRKVFGIDDLRKWIKKD